MLLSIKDLSVRIEGKTILKGINLHVEEGEIHAIMGPNGSGKSTLAATLMGHPSYEIKKGEIYFEDNLINSLAPNERANLGMFLSFQNPRSIDGVNMKTYLHTIKKSKILASLGISLEEARKDKNIRKRVSILSFKKELADELPQIHLSEEFMKRSLNKGFSGGEKKKSEVLQMSFLKPKLAILDELDSGLDVDALKITCKKIMKLQKKLRMSLIIITHFTRIFDYIKPDHVHLFKDGKILKSGGVKLAYEIEKKGYLEQ